MQNKALAAAAALLTAFCAQPAAAVTPTCPADRVMIVRDDLSWTSIKVEIADDPAERAQGLMNRQSLAPETGMLFVYDKPQPVAFWMKNTLIPLDMLFIDDTGVIRYIYPKAQPQDETPIPGAAVGDPDPRRLLVLEIPGGEAERLRLSPGDRVAHPAIPQATAALPCH